MARALRLNTPIRRGVTQATLKAVFAAILPVESPLKGDFERLIDALPATSAVMDVAAAAVDVPPPPPGGAGATEAAAGDAAAAATPAPPPPPPPPCALPEVEVYLCTLVVTTMLREGQVEAAAAAGGLLVERVRSFNRRSLDVIGAKAMFYFARCHQLLGKLSELRPMLLALHRTACLRQDEMGQATLLNLILAGLLETNQVDLASKLVAKTSFPEGVSNNQFCRFLYHTGRICAVQLDYTDAHAKLTQALRKAPAGGSAGAGFRVAAQKLLVVVQLLMGDLPERDVFANAPALSPYFALTQAVRRGELSGYTEAKTKHAATFRADKLSALVERLAQTVVKTGLRRITLSYARISLDDVAKKLGLPSARSAGFVCAKAIKDGVVDAVLDHEGGSMSSTEVANLYETTEPQKAFHRRIVFCLDVHNEAVRAMRYPADAYRAKVKKAEADNAAADDEDEDIAAEIAAEEDDAMDE